jgi:hypothetical protein
MKFKSSLLCTFLFSHLLYADIFEDVNSFLDVDGYIQTSKTITDKDWDFLPKINNSFDYSEVSSTEALFIKDSFGLKYVSATFKLDAVRSIQPKNINLTAESNLLEFIYILSNDNAMSLSIKEQLADTQSIDCYTFSTLTIGFCPEARLTITNSKDKYKALNANQLMLIDGRNQEIKFKLTKAVDLLFIDEFFLYFSVSNNKFDWLSPIEDLTSGFISNLTYGGSTIGKLVENEIKRLPQRDEWLFFKTGVNMTKSIPIFKNINFFYDIDFVYVDNKDYIPFKDIKNHNIKFSTGLIVYNDKNLELIFFGTFYKNNLFGYEDITFNQRSEHHFSSNYGSLTALLKYNF